MRSRLLSTVVGVVVGALLTAGVGYAATVYQNSAQVPVGIEVADVRVTYGPGLAVGPDRLQFRVEPGGRSDTVVVTVTNIGSDPVDGLELRLEGPYQLALREVDSRSWSYGSGAWTLSHYHLDLRPGHSASFDIYIKADTEAVAGSYDLSLQVNEIH